MKPLTVLLGIVLGSAAALAVSLTMTGIVFLLLPEYSERLGPEKVPLLTALAWSWLLALAAAASFVGELKGHAWRRAAQAVVLMVLVGLAWRYWPR